MSAQAFADAAALARLIDHTLLKPVATRAEIEMLCREALSHGFRSVCIAPFWVPAAVRRWPTSRCCGPRSAATSA